MSQENENMTPENDVVETPATETASEPATSTQDKKRLAKKKFPTKETPAPAKKQTVALTSGTKATAKYTKNSIYNVIAIVVLVLIVACLITLSVLSILQNKSENVTVETLSGAAEDGTNLTATFTDAEGNKITVADSVKIDIKSEPVKTASEAAFAESAASKIYYSQKIAADEEIVAVYEITLTDGNKTIQPTDAQDKAAYIKLTLDIPEALRNDPNFKIVHMHADDDVIVYTKNGDPKYELSEDGSTATITTNKLSSFAFVRANEEMPTYTATFIADGEVKGTVVFNKFFVSIPEPAITNKEGYTGAWEEYQLTNSDITINAIYTPIVYTAKFVAGDVTVENKQFTVENKNDVVAPAVPAKDYYTGAWASYALGASDITVEAVYTAIEYTANFVDYSGTTPLTFTFETRRKVVDKANDNSTVAKQDGYTGVWVFDENELRDLNKTATQTITINANYTADHSALHITNVALAGWTYGDTSEHVVSYTVTPTSVDTTGKVSFHYTTVAGDPLPDQPTLAGTYKVYVKVSNVEGFDDKESERVTFTIAQKEVTIAWTNTEFTYDGEAHKPTATVTGGLVGTDEATVTVTGEQTDAGNYTATATTLSNANYKLPAEKTQAFSIAKKVVGIEWTNTALSYTGTAQAPTATATGLIGTDEVIVTVTGAQTAVSNDPYEATATALTGADADNYELPTSGLTQEFTIGKADLSLTVELTGWIYGSAANNPVVTGNIANAPVSYLYKVKGADDNTYSDAVPTDAGEYTVKVNVSASDNYNAGSATNDFTIEQKEVTIEWTNTALTYTGTLQAPNATVTNAEDYDVVNVTVTGAEMNASANAYTATASALTGADAANYKLPNTGLTQEYTIGKANFVPEVSISSWTYGEAASVPEVTGNLGNGAVTYTYKVRTAADSTYTETVPTDAGEYTVRAVIAATTNYNEVTVTANFDIYAAGLTLNVSLEDWDYGRAASVPVVTGNSGNGEETFEYKVKDADDDTYTEVVPTAAGHYTVRVTVESTANYNGDTAEADFEIRKASIYSAVTITGWTYGQSANAPAVTVNPGNGAVTYYYSVKNANDYSETVPTNAGDYEVYASIAATDNYLSGMTDPTYFTIAKADYDMSGISFVDDTHVYDGEAHGLVIGGTLPTGLDEIQVTVEYSGSATTVAEGTQTVTATFATTSTNYNAPAAKQATITITNATITGTLAQDGTLTYKGTAQTASVTGLTSVNSQVITYTYCTTQNGEYGAMPSYTDAGSYTVYYKANAANHNEKSGSFTVTIGKAALTVTADDKEVTYNGAVPTYTATTTGFVNSETVAVLTGELTFTCSYAQGDAVGTYTITPSGYTSSNYEITFVPGTLTVGNASITGTLAQNGALTYNGTAKTASVTGLTAANDQEITITYCTTVDGDYGAMPSYTNAGSYTLYYKANANNNTEKTGTVTITIDKAEYDMSGVTFVNDTHVYDGEAHSLVIGGTLPTGADGIQVTVQYSGSATTVVEGAMTVTATFATTSTNYNAPDAKQATITITKATINGTLAQDGALTYNGTDKTESVTGLTSVNSQDITITYCTTENGVYGDMPTFTNAGDYTVYYKANAANHNEKADSFTVTIGKAALTVTADDNAITYGDAAPTYTATVTGFVNDETVNVLGGELAFTCAYSQGNNVGSYDINVSGYTSGNYSINFVKGTLTVNKADITPAITITGWTYGDDANNPTVTGNAGNGDETVEYKVQGADDNTYTATVPTNAGSYTVRVTIDATTNYNGGTASANFTISKKELSVIFALTYEDNGTQTVDGFDVEYDGRTYTMTVTVTGLATADASQQATVNAAFNNAIDNNDKISQNAGSYNVEIDAMNAVEVNGVANYYCIGGCKGWDITQKEIGLNWSNDELTYNGTAQKPTATATGLVGTDEVLVTVTGEQTDYSADSYTATASALTGADAANYKLPSAKTHAFTIGQKEVTLNWSNTALTYNASAQAPTATVSNAEAGDTVTVTVTGAQTNYSAESYTATASALAGADAANYKLPNTGLTQEFTIGKATLKAQVNYSGSFTFGDTLPSSAYTITGWKGSDNATNCGVDDTNIDFNPEYKYSNNAVDFHVTGLTIESTNYQFEFGTPISQLTFSPREVTVTWTPTTTFTYDGTTKTVTATIGNLVNEYDASFNYSGNSATNAGEYTATITGITAGNSHFYKLPTSGTTQGFVINSATITGSLAQSGSLTYDGTAKTASVTGLTSVNSQAITITYCETVDGEYGAMPSYTNAGSYTVYYKANAANHSEKAGNFTVTIDKADITPEITLAGWTYGDSANAPSINGNTDSGTETVEYKVQGADDNTYTTTVPTKAGSYTVRVTIDATSNYNGGTDTDNFTIAQKVVALNWSSTSLTYTGSAQAPTATVSNAEAGDTVTVTVTGQQTNYSAESYTATASALAGADAANYTLPVVNTTSFTIGKANITGTLAQSGNLTYDGTAQTASATGLTSVNSQTITITYCETENGVYGSMPTFTAAGNNTVYYKANAANHSEKTGSFTVTIGKVALTVTADDKAITYGDAAPTYTATVTGFVNSETVNVLGGDLAFACAYTQGSAVNTYSITPSGYTSGNYDITFVAGTLTVSKKALTVTADNKAITYGDAAPAYTASYSGFITGENETDLGGSLTLSCSYEQGNNAGSYNITATGYTSDNYDISFVAGTLTVNKASITVTVTISGWSTADDPNAPSVSGNTGSGTETAYYKVQGANDDTYTTTVPTEAGSYTVKVVVAETTNYLGGEGTADFTIA